MPRLRRLIIGGVIVIAGTAASGQAPAVSSRQAPAFVGTWVIEMTSPDELKGTREIVRVWDKDGVIAASVQVGKFPANDATGIFRDGDLLVLSTTMRENGVPIWVVCSLKVEGGTMMLAQMMERSTTVKRGVGKKQAQ